MHIKWDNANSYHSNQNQKREKACADKFQITTCIYIMKSRKQQFASKLNICIVVPLFLGKTSIKSKKEQEKVPLVGLGS